MCVKRIHLFGFMLKNFGSSIMVGYNFDEFARYKFTLDQLNYTSAIQLIE